MYLKKIETRIKVTATRAEKFRTLSKEASAAGERASQFRKKFEVKKEVREKFLQKWQKSALAGLEEAINFMVDEELTRIEKTIKPDIHQTALKLHEGEGENLEAQVFDRLSSIMKVNLKTDYEPMFKEGEVYNMEPMDFFPGIKFLDFVTKKVVEHLQKEGFTVSVQGKEVTSTPPKDALLNITIAW